MGHHFESSSMASKEILSNMTYFEEQPDKKSVQTGSGNKIKPHRKTKIGFARVFEDF